MPDMLAEFCTESLVWVSERRLMVCVSGLKKVLSKVYIGLSRPVVIRCHPLSLWLGRSRLILSNYHPDGNELVDGSCKL